MEIQIRKSRETGESSVRSSFVADPRRFEADNLSQRPSKPSQTIKRVQSTLPTNDFWTTKIVDFIVRFSIYITVFLLPLFFLPSVPSILEMNKQMFLVAVVGIGFLAWVGKMAWKNEIRIRKNFILVPIITLLVVFGISSVFSVYPEQSFWGYFGGEGKSFITLLFLVALFILIFSNIRSKRGAINLILVFLLSGFLAGLFGVLQIWGKFLLPLEIAKNPFFNTVGSVYIFGIYMAAMLLMSLALFLDDISRVLKVILAALSFFFFFALMVINFKIIWISLLIAIALILGAAIIRSGTRQSQARILPMIFLVLALLMVLRKQPIIKKELPVEVLLNYKTSAKIALNSWKRDSLLGKGPAMYSLVYEKNRPDNLGDFWLVNFNDGTSYFLTLMATTGILGTFSFLFLVGTGLVVLFRGIAKSASRTNNGDFMVIGTGTVWLFLTIILFAYLGNITTLALWWVVFALFLSFNTFEPNYENREFLASSQSPRSSLTLSFVFVLVIIGFITAIYLQSQKYIAAAYFNKALMSDSSGEDIEKVADYLKKAVEIDPNRDVYYRNLSTAFFALANQRVAEKGEDFSTDDSTYVSTMIRSALQSADRAVTLNPNDPQNYAVLAGVYEGVLATMDQADQRAIENYQKAIEFDPNNPSIYLKIASIYITLSDIELAKNNAQSQQQNQQVANELPEESKKNLSLAKENLNKALQIKGDYADANLLLASIYEREGDLDKAIEKEKENKIMYAGAPGMPFRLGLLYYKNDQMDQAKMEFQEAVNLDKNYSNARYFLGLVLNKQGDKKAALEQFEKIAELNPDNENVGKIVDNLKNGREALVGLDQGNDQAPIEDSQQTSGENTQPNINPAIENQPIPQEATPSPDEIDQNEQPSEENKTPVE